MEEKRVWRAGWRGGVVKGGRTEVKIEVVRGKGVGSMVLRSYMHDE